MIGKIVGKNQEEGKTRGQQQEVDTTSNSLNWGQDGMQQGMQEGMFAEQISAPEKASPEQGSYEDEQRFPTRVDLGIEEVDTPEQEKMDFALEKTRLTRLKQLQNEVRRWEGIVEVLPFWRLAINPINITMAASCTLAIAVLIYANFSAITTNEIPFYFSHTEVTWLLIDKSIFAVFPIAYGALQLILLRFKRSIFDFDRRLSTVMAATQIFFNIMAVIAILQILSLVLN